MKVFNLYGKIIKKNFGSIISYIVAFIVISFLFMGSNAQPTNEFNETKVNVSFINNDEDSALVQGLKDYLDNFVYFKEVEEDLIADALYFREIYIAISVPENFTEQFLNGEDVKIEQQSVPDTTGTISINRAINKYFNTIRVYQDNLDKTTEDIITYVLTDLEKEVSATKTVANDNVFDRLKTFYNFLSYLFYAVIMAVVGIVMMRIKKLDIKRRMSVSPISETKIHTQILLGHLIFTIFILIIMILVSFLFYNDVMNTKNGLLFAINAFCVTIAILSFGYLISLLIKNDNALNAAVNVIALGTSFISGAFIPQFLLGKEMLTFAHILPNYYYITNNERISYLSDFSWNNIDNIVLFMIIQLLFAILFMVISIFISKKQRRQES